MSSEPDCRADQAPATRACLNCGTALSGPYCAQCGQHDIDYHRSFHHLAHDVLENLFHFDGKLFTSVAWLLAKPGRLTADFNAGRRQSQVPPLRFYLFTTVLFFLGVHLLNHGSIFGLDRRAMDMAAQRVQQNVATAEQSAGTLDPQQRAALGALVADAVDRKGADLDAAELARLIAEARAGQRGGNASTARSNHPRIRIDRGSTFGRVLGAKVASGELTMSSLLAQIEQRVPTVLFLGLPVCALLMKLIFRGGGRYYIEHLVFAVHLHTWAFLAVMVGNGYLRLAGLGPPWLLTVSGWLLAAWMLWYLAAAFHTVYGRGWRGTLLRLGALGATYFLALLALLILTVAATVAWATYA